MTPSLGLVFALFLLAPGLALYAGLFLQPRGNRFHPTPPAPGSVLTLAIVTMGALGVHAAWSLLSAANDLACTRVACLSLPFETNIYTIALAGGVLARALPGAEVAVFLVVTVAISGLAYAIGRRASAASAVTRGLFGWLADMVEQSAQPNRFLAVFVLTTLKQGELTLGYEGALASITLGPDREVAAVALREATPFLVTMSAVGVETSHFLQRDPIPLIAFGRDQIENVAFNIFDLSGAGEIATGTVH